MNLDDRREFEEFYKELNIRIKETPDKTNLLRNSLIKQYLDEVKEINKKANLGYYPIFIEELPSYAKDLHKYIKTKVVSDLPQSQLELKASQRNLEEWVEIGGILGYDGQLFEIEYAPPNSSNVSVTGEGRILTSTKLKGKSLDSPDFIRSKAIIDWHTHPEISMLSTSDLLRIVFITKNIDYFFNDKPFFTVLYIPEIDHFSWYKAVKF